MSTSYDIKLKRYNGSDYDILHPETTIAQILGDLPTNRLSGTIAKAQIAEGATYTTQTATLASSGWNSSNQQTVSVTGVTASNLVLVSPAPASFIAYGEANIYCLSQASGTLTFKCESIPDTNITVNVVIPT